MKTTPLSLKLTTTTTPLLTSSSPTSPGCVRLVCLSDTHGKHNELEIPPGDILIHSGDFTNTGTLGEVRDFNSWLGSLPHKHKVVVPGNHDSVMDPVVRKMIKSGDVDPANILYNKEEVEKWKDLEENEKFLTNAHLVINSSVEVEGLKFFGCPHTRYNGEIPRLNFSRYAYSFGCTEESEIAGYLQDSQDCNVLVTHSPPLQIADVSRTSHRGSLAVRDAVFKNKPTLHVFGHVHAHGGNTFKLKNCDENRDKLFSGANDFSDLKTTFVNAASLSVSGLMDYESSEDLLRQAVVVDIDRKTKRVVGVIDNRSSK